MQELALASFVISRPACCGVKCLCRVHYNSLMRSILQCRRSWRPK